MRFVEATARIPESAAPKPPPPGADVAALAANESPVGPSASVLAGITAFLTDVHRYPDPGATALREALATRYGVPIEQIAVGNGAADLLIAAATALLGPDRELVHAWPSFSAYRHLAALTGARAIRVPLDAQARHDLTALESAVGPATAMLLVCNPNNPTSTAVGLSALSAMLDRIPVDVCVVVDEAYCEFNGLDDPDASVHLITQHPNVVLLRTFSKAYALAGLRIGYALAASREFVTAVNKVRQPFGCSAIAQAAALHALAAVDDLHDRVNHNAIARQQVLQQLREMGLRPAESQANFAWFEIPHDDAARVVDHLRSVGVFVAPGAPLGAPNHLRVTFGTASDNTRFLAELHDALASVAT
jgi:histidinol-phosphate aminotransferase